MGGWVGGWVFYLEDGDGIEDRFPIIMELLGASFIHGWEGGWVGGWVGRLP